MFSSFLSSEYAGIFGFNIFMGCARSFLVDCIYCIVWQERGIDYKAALAETEAITAIRYEEFRKVNVGQEGLAAVCCPFCCCGLVMVHMLLCGSGLSGALNFSPLSFTEARGNRAEL
jgi:hypothetical protein